MGYWNSEARKFHFDTFAPVKDARLQAFIYAWLQQSEIGLSKAKACEALRDAIDRHLAHQQHQRRMSAVQNVKSCAYYRNLYAKQIVEKSARGEPIYAGLVGIFGAYLHGYEKAFAKLMAMEEIDG